MPSEKAKENKTLVVTCEACGASVSVELARGVVTGAGRSRKTAPVCEGCYAKGWRPTAVNSVAPAAQS